MSFALTRSYAVGTRVKRGKDWKWGDQDSKGLVICMEVSPLSSLSYSSLPGLGTITDPESSVGWVRVKYACLFLNFIYTDSLYTIQVGQWRF